MTMMIRIKKRKNGHSQFSSVKVTAMIDESSEVTRISRCFYDKLGFEDYGHKVLVLVDNDKAHTPFLSAYPITIKFKGRIFANYPLVNSQPKDAFYHLVIGRDLINQNPKMYIKYTFRGFPSAGPGFRRNCRVTRDLKLATYGKQFLIYVSNLNNVFFQF